MQNPRRPARTRRLSTSPRLLLTGCLAILSSLVISSAASAETLRFKLRGQEAMAGFSSTDDTGCIVTHVFLAAMDADVKAGPGPAGADSRSLAEVSQYDRCTQTELLHAFGETLLPAEAFTISELESAKLQATLLVVDHVSGEELALSVDLTWTAGGETARVKDHYHFTSPVFSVNAKFSAISREAEAYGTVSSGTTNFTPEPAAFALLNSIKAGALEITH
jgi:hypothetical protein